MRAIEEERATTGAGSPMGMFDWFRRRPPTEEEARRVADSVAYFLFPDLAFEDFARLERLRREWGDATGSFLYAATSRLERTRIDRETARRYIWRTGSFEDGREYFAIEYPAPPPLVDPISGVVVSTTLAPYFSVLIVEPATGSKRYFVLGQAFHATATTLREVNAEGKNYHLGPGPAPNLADFFEAVRSLTAPPS